MNNNYLAISSFNEENKYVNYIVFCLCSKYYAINIADVIEVINLPKIDIPENMPLGVMGILNYNDVMIKVIDLCPLLGFETQSFSINNQLIIICVKGQYLGIQADSIVNISQFEAKNIHPIPFKSENSILSNVYKISSDMISIIDTHKVDELLDCFK